MMQSLLRALRQRRDAYILQLSLQVAALLVALAGLGFLAIAGYMALGMILPRPLAALVVGIALLMVSLLMAWCLQGRIKKSTRETRRPPDSHYMEAELGALFGREASDWVGKHGKEASLAALALGVAAGFSPRLRRTMLAVAKDAKSLLTELSEEDDD